jgi:hypothetical protein
VRVRVVFGRALILKGVNVSGRRGFSLAFIRDGSRLKKGAIISFVVAFGRPNDGRHRQDRLDGWYAGNIWSRNARDVAGELRLNTDRVQIP